MSFIYSENVRSEEQAKVMADIAQAEVCPFCSDNLKTYHKKPIYADGKYWILTENQWPYEGSKVHLFAIAKEHIETLEQVSTEAAAELFELFKKGAKDFDIKGGTVAMRISPTAQYGSSVKHLHAHFIEPDVEREDHLGMKFPMSKPSTRQT